MGGTRSMASTSKMNLEPYHHLEQFASISSNLTILLKLHIIRLIQFNIGPIVDNYSWFKLTYISANSTYPEILWI